MKKYAVLIGNSQFPNETTRKSELKDLACPENDIEGLGRVLASERGGFEVVSLKNQPSYEILDQLQDVVNRTTQDDLLLIYYSGHGKQNKAGILHLTTLDTVISKLESRAISINRVYDILGTAKCTKIVIILDCCRSGAAGINFRGGLDAQLEQLSNARGTYLVTASTEYQDAIELPEEGYGLFTKHLIAGLETGEADKDGDGWVSMNELYDYVQGKVVAENPAQHPTEHVKNRRGMNLPIAKSGKNLFHKPVDESNKLLELYKSNKELFTEKKITFDDLDNSWSFLNNPKNNLSPLQKKRYDLLKGLINEKNICQEFIKEWIKGWNMLKSEYLPVYLKRTNDGILEISEFGKTENRTEPLSKVEWLKKINGMNNFMYGQSNEVKNIGVAIGTQNFLWLDNELYLGIRRKVREDSVKCGATKVKIGLGAFNTGYKLLRTPSHLAINEGIQNIENLFIVPNHSISELGKENKASEEDDNPIRKLKERLPKKNLIWINIDKKNYLATITMNFSHWYPRFEIGIVNFIQPESESKIDFGLFKDIGYDKFSDEDAFYVWISNGQIKYWSFQNFEKAKKNEFHIDYKGNDKDKLIGLLVSTDRLKKGCDYKTDMFTIISDEEITPENIITIPLTSPARALTELFF